LPPRSHSGHATRPTPWQTMHLNRSMMLPFTRLRPFPLQPGHMMLPLFEHVVQFPIFLRPGVHAAIFDSPWRAWKRFSKKFPEDAQSARSLGAVWWPHRRTASATDVRAAMGNGSQAAIEGKRCRGAPRTAAGRSADRLGRMFGRLTVGTSRTVGNDVLVETPVEREPTVGSAAEEATALESGTMASDAPMNPTTKADTIASTLGQGPNDAGAPSRCPWPAGPVLELARDA